MNMVKIHIDGKDYDADPGKNLLHTCLALGFDIPYFCYHPAMGSVGACRQCAVKKFAGPDDKEGKIIMSCMEPVVEGLRILTNDPEVKAFRAAVIESLMTNHPHDCPVCDEGGECHLQDMTVMTGHNYRRFVFKKRTYNNQYLGPYIQHEMNRCIQCYRCVRFYRDYAGGKDFDVFGSASRIYFGRQKEGPLESVFSGNLVEVCPTGVFTDKKLREHYTRKWDLTNAPSICINCSLGCNIIIGERYSSVRRILSRYNGAVNGYFICDRGRFGYEYLNGPERIREVLARPAKSSNLEKISEEGWRSEILAAIKGKKIAGIGSPRASLESNFALETLVGRENFYHGIAGKEFSLMKSAVEILKSGFAHSASLKDIEKSDTILVLGEDLINSAPMMALAVRQAARNKSIGVAEKSGIAYWNDSAVREMAQQIKSPVFIVTPSPTNLDDIAELSYQTPASEIARVGAAIVFALDNITAFSGIPEKSLNGSAQKIAASLMSADNPLIVTGLSCDEEEIMVAASNIAKALSGKGKKPSLSFVFPEFNSCGLALMDGKPLDKLIEVINKGNVDSLIVLENDLYSGADKEKTDLIFNKCSQVVVLASMMDDTSKRADILFPAATFAESTGTIVNNEGRAQRYYRVLPESSEIRDSWKYLSEMIKISGTGKFPDWEHFDDVVSSFIDSYPFFSNIREIMPDSKFRLYNEKIARQTARFSGRTAMNANIEVSEPRPPDDPDSSLAFSMEGYKGITPSYFTPYYWSPGWNSVQAMNKYMDEPDGKLKDGNPGVLLINGKTGNAEK